MSFDIGPRILVKGEKEFNSSIKSIDQSFKTLSSEMRLVETRFAGNEKSTESLTSQNQVLTKQIENQKDRLSTLNTQYQKQLEVLHKLEDAARETAKANGENSKEVANANKAIRDQQTMLSSLQTGINNTTANLETMERQWKNNTGAIKDHAAQAEDFSAKLALEQARLEKTTTEIDNNSDSIGKNRSELQKLNVQRESLNTQIDLQVGKISALESELQELTSAENQNERAIIDKRTELTKAKTELANYQGELNDVSNSLGRASDRFKEFGDKLESGGRKMMPATLAIAGAGAAAFKMGADLEDAMGATDQVFGNSSDAMKEWAKNLEEYYGVSERKALEYGNVMGTMLQNIGGLTEDEAAKQSQTLIKLSGDLAATFGTSTEDAVHALTGALKGNNSMLDNYGMGINEAVIKTKALEMGLKSEKGEMTLASKQAATLALIMEQSAKSQGQAAREADSASGSIRTLSTSTENLASSYKDIILPAILPFVKELTTMIQKFTKMDEGSKKTIVTILGIVAAVGPLLIMAGKVSLAISSILGLAGKLGGLGLISSLSSAATAVGGVVAAIGIVPIAIAAAILAVGLFGDEIKAGLLKADSFMQNIFAKDWTETFGAAGEVVNAFFKNFKGAWDALVKFVVGIIDFIRGVFTGDWKRAWGGLADAVTAIFDGMAAGLKAPINGIIGFINMMIDGINQMIRGMNKLKFDIPDWVPIIGGKEFKINISEIGKIPLLATGGYLSSGSAIVGEAGAELLTMMGNKAKVTPLTNGGKPPIAPAYQIGELIINPNAQQWNELMTLLQQSRVAQQQRRAWG